MMMSKDNIYQRVNKVFQDISGLTKDKQNPFFKSSYVDINSLLDQVKPQFAKNGIGLDQSPQLVDGLPCLRTWLVNLDDTNDFIESNTPLIYKQGDAQSLGGSITYMRRYSLVSMLGLEAYDDDGSAATGKTKNADKKAQKQDFVDKAKFFEIMGKKKEWDQDDKKQIDEAVDWLSKQDSDSVDMEIVRNAYATHIHDRRKS